MKKPVAIPDTIELKASGLVLTKFTRRISCPGKEKRIDIAGLPLVAARLLYLIGFHILNFSRLMEGLKR